MPDPQVWRCYDCGKSYTSTIQIKEVIHRCKDGRRNIPMELQTTDEEKK